MGKLSGGHQAAIMVMGVDQVEDKDIVITGSKDHYIKVNRNTSSLSTLDKYYQNLSVSGQTL